MAKKQKDELDLILNDKDNLLFLGGLATASAVSGGGQAAGMMSGMINPNTRGVGAASGALKGAEMGSMLGPLGMAAGAAIGGITGLISGGKMADQAREDEFNNDIKQRNKMLGIKANGGYIVPIGVSPNLQTQYAEGGQLTEFNTGGSHEENPINGIPQGMDQNGIPNKVEQGETKWQDYIFSDRLLLDDNTVNSLNLPRSMKGKTFAEASKRMAKSHKERPNDPISRDTVKDHMSRLMMANDKARMMEESSLMAKGGRLYKDGSKLLVGNKIYDTNNPSSEPTLALRYGNNFYNPQTNKIESNKPDTKLINPLSIKSQNTPNDSSKSEFNFFGDSKNLRYAPIAFDALASTGLFGKTPNPETITPTLIQQPGQLTAPKIDEMQMRNQVDSAYQSSLNGQTESAGGSASALRSNLNALSNDYMSGIGKAYVDANNANNASKMQADQFNLQMQGNVASQNAQLINRADMYNNSLINQAKDKNYENRMSYLGKAAEGLGDIGYENRMAELMPKLYGYDQYGNYNPTLKACGGRLRLKKHKK